ncbi:MAG: methyltransferase domain-containing protein [Armatimonadota bacterium]|nr:methyltransferase domain-containing protein [Armatimonadota bacterium]
MDTREREALITELQRAFVDRWRVAGSIRTEAVEEAFRAVPRHLFVDRYYEGDGLDELVEVDPEAPTEEQLRRIYSEAALVSHVEDGTPRSSTSQPPLVADMLETLLPEPGMKVLEIGAGTGWNAALMGHIVGPEGSVTAIDIQEDVVLGARRHIRRAGTANVSILHGDGGHGHEEGAPYDRIITTANCHEISPHWAEQLAPGGALLVTLRDLPGSSMCLNLRLWRRKRCLKGEVVGWSGFMTLRGDYGTDEVARRDADERLEELADGREAEEREAPWGYLGLPEHSMSYMLRGLAFFAQLEGLQVEQIGSRFAMSQPESGDLCVVAADAVQAFGGRAYDALCQITRRWIELGAPRQYSYRVEAWPLEIRKRRPRDGWLLRREHTQLIFGLKDRDRDRTMPW